MSALQALVVLEGGSSDELRCAAALRLQRCLGLRLKESFLFNPVRDLLPDGVYVHRGCKGGRERRILSVSEAGREAIRLAEQACEGGKNLIPAGMRLEQWARRYRYLTEKAGTRHPHGNRHAYARNRYTDLSGPVPPCKFKTVAEFVQYALSVAGPGWKEPDRLARDILKGELGHGPDREDVVSQYIGASQQGKTL